MGVLKTCLAFLCLTSFAYSDDLAALVKEQQKQIAELTRQVYELKQMVNVTITERNPKYKMVLDNGIPVVAKSEKIVRVIGQHVEIITIWENGNPVPIDVIYGLDRIPKPRMEIARGSNVQTQEFQPRLPPVQPQRRE